MKTLVVDLDGTLCSNAGEDADYNSCFPYPHRISVINKLYDAGAKIIIDTARGNTTGIDWTDVTESQLQNWGVKYHTLRVGVKFSADYYIDDKAINDIDFFEEHFKKPL